MDVFKDKQISDSSKKLYLHNLKRLNDGVEFKNLNYLKKFDSVDAKLETLKPNTKRTYLIAIVSACKNDTRYKKVYDYYYKHLEQLNKQLRDNTVKTEKEEKNWLQPDEIHEKYGETFRIVDEIGKKKKLTQSEYDRLLNLVIFSLYYLIPPRRNLDFINMHIDKPDEDKDKNYYYRGKFYFNRFKTAKTYKQQVVEVPDELDALLKFYLKYKPKVSDKLLVRSNEKPLNNSSDMTHFLERIFGKKIGASMLRKFYLTTKYSGNMNALEMDSTAMGTSVDTIKMNYIKKE